MRISAVALGVVVAHVLLYGAAALPRSTALTLQRAAQQSNPFAGARLYVDPNTNARRQAETWARSRPRDAALIRRIADQPAARWVGDWVRDVRREVGQAVATITRAGALPVFVAYRIPGRDCGLYSAGGARDADAYRRWIRDFAAGIGGRRAIVILEPDALAGMDCLSAPARAERVALIRDAVQVLKGRGASVYIDAGNAKWHQPAEIANRLRQAGIGMADGFALNVSNFLTTPTNIAYGERVSRLVGSKHFVIDTSRNGAVGTDPRHWCNPRGRALGVTPTTNTGHPLVDAYLWVKLPGESDGTCEGGPRAGAWWAEYALELSRMAAVLSGTGR